jgi:hypothetical protein
MEQNYVTKNQIIIDHWKNKFDILFPWDIKFVYDDEHWCHTVYDLRLKKAKIFPCDIEAEDDYLLHQVLKMAFIASEISMEAKLALIVDLTTIIKDKIEYL